MDKFERHVRQCGIHECIRIARNRQAEIDELVDELIQRDGGAHDVDCRSRSRMRQCNCGHDSTVRLLAKHKGE